MSTVEGWIGGILLALAFLVPLTEKPGDRPPPENGSEPPGVDR